MLQDLLSVIIQENIDNVKDLIKLGIDLDLQTRTGWTPLIMASYLDSIDIVKLLIEAGADVDISSYALRTFYTTLLDKEVEGLPPTLAG